MKTRVELWKNYRAEIEHNINLQKSVKHSNETLSILYDRLLRAFPEYPSKYQISQSIVEASTQELTNAPKYSNSGVEKILNEITQDKTQLNFNAIENIDFSSHDLDDVIQSIRKHRTTRKSISQDINGDDVVMKPTKEIQLSTDDIELKNLDPKKEEKHMKKINIAIDGPSGSGKSTVAKMLAEKYELNYINTGLVYRAIALNLKNKNIDFDDNNKVINSLNTLEIKLLPNEEVELNGILVTKELREDDISQGASKVSAIPEVRVIGVKIQKEHGKKSGTIMEGRDTTFVVMPNADIKIYLDTEAETRAQRRLEQNKELGYNTNYEEILSEIKERDYRDKNRDKDPLHITEDAIYIDASKMSINEVVEKISETADKL